MSRPVCNTKPKTNPTPYTLTIPAYTACGSPAKRDARLSCIPILYNPQNSVYTRRRVYIYIRGVRARQTVQGRRESISWLIWLTRFRPRHQAHPWSPALTGSPARRLRAPHRAARDRAVAQPAPHARALLETLSKVHFALCDRPRDYFFSFKSDTREIPALSAFEARCCCGLLCASGGRGVTLLFCCRSMVKVRLNSGVKYFSVPSNSFFYLFFHLFCIVPMVKVISIYKNIQTCIYLEI